MTWITEEITLIDKFYSFTEKHGTRLCWEWVGTFFYQGYGRMYHHSTIECKAHRISYELHFGSIPDGLSVLHKCDNRWCVNPNHLYAGTHKNNMDDLRKAGTLKGERNPASKLTEDVVLDIRNAYHLGEMNTYDLAEKHGVSQVLIARVVKGKQWKHVGGPISKGNKRVERIKPIEVIAIREEYNQTKSILPICIKYNRHVSTIERIIYGITHKGTGGPIEKR